MIEEILSMDDAIALLVDEEGMGRAEALATLGLYCEEMGLLREFREWFRRSCEANGIECVSTH